MSSARERAGTGVLVRSVEKGSRGEQAGFRAGDVVTKINGSPVNDCSDFTRLLRKRADNKAAVTEGGEDDKNDQQPHTKEISASAAS